ncbi:MAG: ABC transporter permease [Acidobacteria bacterium]|nr:ABC transporter permease [Acidobacteriota bacterium]
MLLKNYIITAARNIKKHKVFSLINIAGLAIGLSVFILGYLFLAFNDSFDNFHKDAGRIYGIVQVLSSNNQVKEYSAIIPAPFMPALRSEFPEIEDAVRFNNAPPVTVTLGDKKIPENRVYFADSNFFSFFTFKIVQGNPASVISESNTVVLTESAALKYFGSENPIGRVLTFNSTVDVRVTGVVKDLPLNSSIQFDFLTSMETARSMYGWMEDWHANAAATFLRLPKGFDPAKLNAKFPGFLQKYIKPAPNAPERLLLLPLLDFRTRADSVRLQSFFTWGIPYEICYFFIFLSLAALLVVCINFMNLYTAQNMGRSLEVGLRKVVGANRFELVKQFLGESILLALIALPVSMILYQFLKKAFIAWVGADLYISILDYPASLVVFLAITVIVGCTAGSYPAFFLSAFQPSQMLKGFLKAGKKKSLMRKILVVSQFATAVILIVFTTVTGNQMDYLRKMDFGFKRDGLLLIPLPGNARDNIQPMKEKLLMNSSISLVSAGQQRPVNYPGRKYRVIPEGTNETEKWTMRGIAVDYDFIEMLDIKIKQGRSFSRKYSDEGNFIINETAAHQLKWQDPVGKRLTLGAKNGIITGVFKDCLFDDIHFKIEPTVLYIEPKDFNYLFVKIATSAQSSQSLPGIISYIKEQWHSLEPNLPFEYSLLENVFNDHYQYINQMALIFGLIGTFAIFVSCLGLLGLTSYMMTQRTREIGIRKAIGASGNIILKMLFSEFMRLIALANLIGWPLAYLIVGSYLKWTWAYRTNVNISAFIFAAVVTFAAAALAISYHTFKASRINTVTALKYE